MELYVQYKDYNWMMDFTEKLLERICISVNGCSESFIDGKNYLIQSALSPFTDSRCHKRKNRLRWNDKSEDEIRTVCKELKMEIDDRWAKVN